ncbi:MAG: phage portal protein family protein [Arcticibacter sp.]
MKFPNIFGRNKQTLTAEPKEKPKRYLPYESKAVFTTRQDIASWKMALKLAQSEEPRNFRLQLLYNEIMNDALLTSQINNRKQQVLSINFSLKKKNGEVDEEQTQILRKHPIYRTLTNAILDQIYYGYSLVELEFKPDLNGKRVLTGEVIPRTNVVPQTGLFYEDYFNTNGTRYREMPEFGLWILEYNSGNLGMLNKAVSHVLFKRFAQSCWSELCEIYGIPPRVMKTNTQDTVMLNRAEQMMQDMGAAAWFIIDDTEEFEFAQGVSTKGEVYENLMTFCGNEISMLISGAIIGQDTKNGNRSKEESSQEMLWYLVQSDMALLEEQWNNINIPALVKHGVIKGDLTFEYDETEDLEQLWNITKDALQYLKVDPEWVKRKFGIEVTGEREQKQGTQLQLDGSFFALAPETTTGANMKDLAKACCGDLHTLTLSKEGIEEFDDDALIKRFWDAKGALTFDIPLFYYASTTLIAGLKKGWDKGKKELAADIGFDYDIDDPAVLTAYEMNLFRFSAAKTLAEAQRLNELFRSAKSYEQFYTNSKLVTEVFNKEWLLTEYQTAGLTGESAATYTRLNKQKDVFPYWKYMTVGDHRVRPEHVLLDGLILAANDPRWKKLWPPNGWKCRCYVVGVMKHEVKDVDMKAMQARADAYFATTEFKTASATGWGVNRAESGEVFTANQLYINKFPGKASKILDNLKPADYKLKSYSQAKKVASDEAPMYSGSVDAFLKDNKPFFDYHNRKVELNKSAFKNTSGDHDQPTSEYLEAFKNSILQPDEVWINGTNYEEFVSVKYYTDKTLIVVTRIKDGTRYQVRTFFPLSETKEAIDRYRRGLLIFNRK